MIRQIQLLENIGQFEKVAPLQDTAFAQFSLLYAENARGKTTLSAIFRSLAEDDPKFVNERRRLGSIHPPRIVLKHDGDNIIFEDGKWSTSLPNIVIFDDAFVANNVCSGMDVENAHRKNLHEFIIGAQGVKLYVELQGHIQRAKQHQESSREIGKSIPEATYQPFSIEEFCRLQENKNIDEFIQDAERNLAAAQSADEILQHGNFSEITLPDFDLDKISSVLKKDILNLEGETTEATRKHVRAHIDKLGENKEMWVAEGVPLIEHASEGKEQETCPFCAQNLAGSELILSYREYFNNSYKNNYDDLKKNIKNFGIEVRDTHSEEISANFGKSVQKAMALREFWGKFIDNIPYIEVDIVNIIQDWSMARESVLEQLRAKLSMPLESIDLTQQDRDCVEKYRNHINTISALSTSLMNVNSKLDHIRKNVDSKNIIDIQENLAKLKAQKARFDPAIAQKCDAYNEERAKKRSEEKLRDEAREKLANYRGEIFKNYQRGINEYLDKFGASFSINEMKPVNHSAGSSAHYRIKINGKDVNLNSDDDHSFRNTLSSGDRNALALAFFLVSLDLDPDLSDKIVIIDDPVTSLDEHRSLQTCREIVDLTGRVRQVIVMSHSKSFLFRLWEQIIKIKTPATPLHINRALVGSELIAWNVNDHSLSEHDKRHELVRKYLQKATPGEGRQVAEALRHILEDFLRVAYPEHFPPGEQLGNFIHKCEEAAAKGNRILTEADLEELRVLKDYARKFHHTANQTEGTEEVNDTELVTFSRRTISFTSRPLT